MNEDLFDYVVSPTKTQYKKETIIDQIYGIPKLKIPPYVYFTNSNDYLIDNAICNYNNEVAVAKMFYVNMIKYHNYYLKRKNNSYDFWSKKHAEQIIKELFAIYDKSMHILNYLYDLKIMPDMNFKENVRKKIKECDKQLYKKINKIYSKLYGDKKKNTIRDNITHNFSDLFFRYKPEYRNNKSTGWFVENPLSFEEYNDIIGKICELLHENKEIITNKLREVYPSGNENIN